MSDETTNSNMDLVLGFYGPGVTMYEEEVADRGVINKINEAHPHLRKFFVDMERAVYLVLYPAALGFFDSQAVKPLPGEHPPNSPAQFINLGRQFFERAYYDAWVEAHVSGAYDDLDGLPEPENWPPEAKRQTEENESE